MSEYPTENIELCAKDEEIARHKDLHTRAADALDRGGYAMNGCCCGDCMAINALIDELRKAAE